ncbi:uncharacterized protein FSUBG_5465 [Fusarium subglutinans]|uniref:C2H2-type domain-containing protein n=1 Tax=Gibberella subglutinans TaxID=42677 RepID=A0A8H5V152_GIBSU|nr:uncharacterized protein FSUBG_5465 [Fusarium subglutinans]KAF5607007.1 hypothetical protein FSUBG_5465 [Fusarium subglutinans]
MPSSTVEDLLSAPEQQIRAVLGVLCQDEDTRSRALDHYHSLQATPEVSDGRKRKAEDEMSVCVRCKKAFDKHENTDERACRYHPGFMNADDQAEAWADYDGLLEDVETEEYWEEHPEAFIWDCCDNRGTEEGCTYGKHEVDVKKSKKGDGNSLGVE